MGLDQSYATREAVQALSARQILMVPPVKQGSSNHDFLVETGCD
jgi:hypothetical protein